jgi:hypothetical protein
MRRDEISLLSAGVHATGRVDRYFFRANCLVILPHAKPCSRWLLLKVAETAAPFPQRWGLLRKGRTVFRREDRVS